MINNRQSIRLKNYDYSQSGWYFITICTENRECLFGHIINHPVGVGRDRPVSMVLNECGKIVELIWQSLPKRFPIVLDKFQIMPNHIHMIIHLVGVSFMKPYSRLKPEITMAIAKSNRHMGLINQKMGLINQTPTLGHIIRYFKSKCTFEIHKNGFNNNLFQRNYYEQIIRNEIQLNRIRQYIKNNPNQWNKDVNNPSKYVPIANKNS